MSIISISSASDTAAIDELDKCMRSGRVCVLFHANWCGHCQQLKPEWERLKSMFTSGSANANCQLAEVESNAVEAVRNKMSDVPSLVEFSGYPTISMYNGGEKLGDYDSERTADAMMSNLTTTFGTSTRKANKMPNNKNHATTKSKKHKSGKKHKKNKTTRTNNNNNNKAMNMTKRNIQMGGKSRK